MPKASRTRVGEVCGAVLPNAKISTTVRLDADVLEHLRRRGPGWQTRINAALRSAIRKRAAG